MSNRMKRIDDWFFNLPYKTKEFIGVGLVSLVCLSVLFLLTMVIVSGCKQAPAKSPSVTAWVKSCGGSVVDVDPYIRANRFGLLIELHDGNWVLLSQGYYRSETWPGRGETGIFYKRKENGVWVNKWEVDDTPKRKVASAKTDDKKVVVPVARKMLRWENATSLPPIEQTVLVRYKDGITVTTAYVTRKKEWKLETDRDKISGGREITTVQEWKEIEL